ncbi:glycoside hydrolase family 125 protein [Bifidobacterium aerophilum]|uniref:Metal-independent alpha-mannosidase n=1 Tax=Bifidobacterium aerophilum TaxID=1798155 RepID=A0A6N9Z7B2_9BIFI|nr:glycoside hydrolase family 125 protein [Bifidobacterium aerophilum]NEG90023.1 metal-independent alpha-mannosidase [Bifidobacterium aerophilum]
MPYAAIPESVQDFINRITKLCGAEHADWSRVFANTFADTLLTTVDRLEDGTTYVITGDIPAMWLRDSTAQVRPYLPLAADDPELADMIAGLVKRQFMYITIDPYANAFNRHATGTNWPDDITEEQSPWVWERKYELDSLCYPVQLAWLLYRNTGRTDQFDATFVAGVKRVLQVIETEQDHRNRSPYTFQRLDARDIDTLPDGGKGTPVAADGMTWSGFRPADDACTYGYLVPANMFAVVILSYVERIFSKILDDPAIVRRARRIGDEIRCAIEKDAITTNRDGEEIYAYETDGMGHFNVMDDANVPSLLSAAYLGYASTSTPRYAATRRTVLSDENPYYYTGRFASGIGSPHTPEGYVWPIAMALEGLTSDDADVKRRILDDLVAIDDGTDLMHEGVDVDDPSRYTRPWFSWANMMFCELVMDYYGIRVKR